MRSAPLMSTEGLAPVALELHHEVTMFLYEEAEVLDDGRFRAWLDMLTEDIAYRMPIRVTTAHTLATSLLDGADHFHEDRYSLEKRVHRFETDHAWTEDPPSRTRRFVSNIRAWAAPEGDDLIVKSYLLLFRSRGDVRQPDWASAERTDVLRRAGDRFQIAQRLIAVDESVLRTQNLAVFL